MGLRSVMGFLIQEEDQKQRFKDIWSSYSVKLRELTLNDFTIIEAKQNAEDALYGRVCRTERISAAESADIIDDSSVKQPLAVSQRDIQSYVQAQQLLDEMGANLFLPVDYIKSSPYLLSFMRDYQLKRKVENYFREHPNEVRQANKDCLWLNRNVIDNYNPIEAGNARLDLLKEHAFANKAELLLWVPPAKPYYQAPGLFQGIKHFSKILVFSSWEMVPRMIASMLSYEAERKTIGKLAKQAKREEQRDARYYPATGKRFPPARLNFKIAQEEPRAMNLFCLIYPSEFLAACFDPIDTLNRRLTLAELEKEVQGKIAEKLASLPVHEDPVGRVDDRWYYLAPLLMDSDRYVATWFKRISQGADEGEEEDELRAKGAKAFPLHLEQLKTMRFEPEIGLGRKPHDLLEVLTNMAIASPAICAYRTYGGNPDTTSLLDIIENGGRDIDRPSQLAKVFLNRMNTPEATAVIEVYYGKSSDDAHWKNLLRYCKEGNLQAVLDEYAHILVESNGLNHCLQKTSRLHRLMLESMNVRSVPYTIDTFKSFKRRIKGEKSRSTTIRTHFAVAFTKGEGNTSRDADRKKTVRNSFNSPFRPFVLATTSIGQEGLDFHYYCRKIVHWNLPSNPIDLEQREGRINRFKCLAIRQNVAERYGDTIFSQDIWTEMFENALKHEKTANGSELIPFWCLSDHENLVKIERIVPMYPLSRDITAYERLIKILSLYRLTLGQARQEELLEYIFKNCGGEEELKQLFMNLSPFYKDYDIELYRGI